MPPQEASSLAGLRSQLYEARERAKNAPLKRKEPKRLRMRASMQPAEHSEDDVRLAASQHALASKAARYEAGYKDDEELIDWDSKGAKVEYEDEFGRTRTGDDAAIYGPATSFPVYIRPDVPVPDVRPCGAAYYRFAQDAETRQSQQAALSELRKETLQERGKAASTGAARREARRRFLTSFRAS